MSVLQTTVGAIHSNCWPHFCSSCGSALTKLYESCYAASDKGSRQRSAGLDDEQVPALSLDHAGGPSVHILMQLNAALARELINCAAMSSFALCRPLAICEHNYQK